MKSKRIIAIMLVVVCAMGILSGCGKPSDKDENGKTILSVGNWPTKEGSDLDIWNNKKDKFEAENTDVAVYPDNWKFERTSFYAKAAGGELPTIYQAGFTEMPEIIASEYGADITEAMKKYGYDKALNPKVLEAVSEENKIYAFPYSAYILGVAVHMDLMKEAGLVEADGTPMQPKDWNEVVEFAVKIKEKTGKAGIVFPTANKTGGWIFTNLAWSFGTEFMKQDSDGKWIATFDSQECVDALQYIKDLKWKYDVLPANNLIDGAEKTKVFATGQAAMLISAGEQNSVVAYGMKPDQYGMVAMPAGPKRHVTMLGGSVYCVAPDSSDDQKDAALRWIKESANHELDEHMKERIEANTKLGLEQGKLVGVKSFNIWNGDLERSVYTNQMVDKYANANPNHVRLYNEFAANCTAEVQPEEPVCAQELYEILDACIQEVLTNKDADCKAIIKKAASDFQRNYLDNLVY